MSELVIVEPAGLPATERHERMAQQARASKAEGTWRAYGSDWQIWETWAAANGVTAMPADPGRVAEFLSDMTVTRKLSTVRRYLASISVSHTLKGHQFERKHPSIKTILRGAARGAPLPRRVRPLLAKQVRALLRELGDHAAERREIERALLTACAHNGLLRDDGVNQCEATLASGMRKSQHDALPMLGWVG